MSEGHFESALRSLQKPQDSKRLLQILVIIRKEIEWPRNKDNMLKLRDNGCFKPIVGCLNIQNGNILDVVLSIIGNCCMERNSARDLVRTYNILPVLTQLLQAYEKHDSVNGRVFRIVGNICQHIERLSNHVIEKEPKLIDGIVKFLKASITDENTEAKVSKATINMGIRALRELLNSCSIVPLVKKHEVLKVVGMLLIKYTPQWLENKENEDILNNIIRLLHEYSRYKYSDTVLQLRNTGNGDSLVSLGNLILLSPRRIVKIIMNLIKISSLKSDLPIPETCESLMNTLKNNGEVIADKTVFKEYLQCLCLLLEHPANRDDTRNRGSIPFLIDVLRQFKTPDEFTLECSILILSTLKKCMYSESLVVVQIKCGIIKVLIQQLEWIVGSSVKIDLKHEFRKKKYNSVTSPVPVKRSKNNIGLSVDSSWLPQSPSSTDDDFDSYFSNVPRRERSSSPSSSSELSFSSGPSQSPPSSPLLSVKGNSDDSDSDDYSPVCSEMDEEDFPLVLQDVENISVEPSVCETETSDVAEYNFDDDSVNMEDLSSKANKSTLSSLKGSLVLEIAKILKWFSKVRPVIMELGCPELLILLVKSSKSFSNHSSVETLGIILNILESQEYLLPLMQTDFIPVIYDLTSMVHGSNCVNCKQYSKVGQQILSKITELAESGGGKGDIAHQLLRASVSTRQKLVLTIPYIVKNKVILSRLMITCGGLNILMKLLLEKSDVQMKSIKVMCAMALKRGIKSPTDPLIRMQKSPATAKTYSLPRNCANIVTFKLDDGTHVKADRDFLSEKSVYFNKLLSGQFKESHEKEIALRNVANKSLKTLLSLLQCDINRTEVIELDFDLATLLDVIALSDRYLLFDLCVSLTSSVEQFRISTETVPAIYQWSLESGTNILRVESIAFALVCNILDSERFAMFRSLFDLGYAEQLVEDIQKLLERFLNMRFKD